MANPLIPYAEYPDDSFNRFLVENLIDTALACPNLKALAQKAARVGDPLHGKTGPIEVEYDPEECRSGKTFGFTDHTYRYIVLGIADTFVALNILMFEVANASQTTEYRALQKLAKDRRITADNYVKGVEQIEETSKHLHHKIALVGIATLGWEPEVDVYKKDVEEPFEHYWHRHLRFSPHAQFLRKQYAQITQTQEVFPGQKEQRDSAIWLKRNRLRKIS